MASYVLSFDDYQPGERLDGIPWVQAEIAEAATQDGAYTVIETINLDPVDTDPADPQLRSFTTDRATIAAGWYQITFIDDTGGRQPTEPVYNSAQRAGYTPGVGDVGALLTARTRDSNGREPGTFTATTRPTRDQVERLIEKSAQRVVVKLGDNTPEQLWEQIANVIALAAAMRVELSFFPDQITAGRSPYNELKGLRDEEFADLLVALEAYGAESGVEDPHAPALLPEFAFPSRTVRAPGAEEKFPGWPYGPDPWDRPFPLWRDW